LTGFLSETAQTNSLSKTVLSVKPLFKRFKRFKKSLYDLKRLIFESELVSNIVGARRWRALPGKMSEPGFSGLKD